jgi:hypothetical protein
MLRPHVHPSSTDDHSLTASGDAGAQARRALLAGRECEKVTFPMDDDMVRRAADE